MYQFHCLVGVWKASFDAVDFPSPHHWREDDVSTLRKNIKQNDIMTPLPKSYFTGIKERLSHMYLALAYYVCFTDILKTSVSFFNHILPNSTQCHSVCHLAYDRCLNRSLSFSLPASSLRIPDSMREDSLAYFLLPDTASTPLILISHD